MQQPHQRDKVADMQTRRRWVDSAVNARLVIDMLAQLRADVSQGRVCEMPRAAHCVRSAMKPLDSSVLMTLDLSVGGPVAEARYRRDGPASRRRAI
jgi:hypothetical protein